tara:strand:- start:7699 stop:8166 length:468 start_codon:yes stop_codon:yes gene_type:complete
MENNINDYMEAYLGHLKSAVLWFHAAHHVTKGAGFASDHKELYGKIYSHLDDNYDLLIEKSIVLSGDEMIACPLKSSRMVKKILCTRYETPANKKSRQIVHDAIVLISDLINSLSHLYESFKVSGYLTLGMEDALTSMSSEYEQYLYLLGQRYKE